MAANIIDRVDGGSFRNDSGYVFHLDKWQQKPAGVEEVEGYREKWQAGDHAVTRVFSVPWSAQKSFVEWALGYSYIDLSARTPDTEAALAQAVLYYSTAPPPDGSTLPQTPPWRLRRIIPAQDPVRPWLFCSECELIETKGAMVEDEVNFLKDAKGADVIDPTTGEPILVSAMAYGDNSANGTWAHFETVFPDPANPTQGEDEIVAPNFKFRDGKAFYRLTFTPRPYEVRTDSELDSLPDGGSSELNRYVRREEKYSVEAIPLVRLAAGAKPPADLTKGGPLTFCGKDPAGREVPASVAGVIVPEAGMQQLPTAYLRYTWYGLPSRPLASYAACVGKINSNVFDGLGGSVKYPAQTLLCMPWETVRRCSPCGQVVWDITYNFMFRPPKWNYFPTAFGGFYLATFGGTQSGPRVYPEADFKPLFLVPPPTKYV